jgi:AmmeMemoRadiSam system protein B
LRNLPVDDKLREQILATGQFSTMKQGIDEREHSGEMQYPFIAKIINDLEEHNMSEHDNIMVKVLPIMVGSIKRAKEESFGKLLSSFLSNESIFTLISSDFCHWGERFSYTPHPPRDTNESINEVHEYIEYLDKKGMDLISLQRPGAFADYLRDYSNTICGRHPIAVWLNSVVYNKEEGRETLDVRFVKYAQSGKAVSKKDFSVSYASAVARRINSD